MSTLSEPHLYQLEVGPWVDIAFLTIAASCVDLLHLRALHSPLDHLCHWVPPPLLYIVREKAVYWRLLIVENTYGYE